jgi:hypothetical protein
MPKSLDCTVPVTMPKNATNNKKKLPSCSTNDMVGHQPEEQDWMVFISVYFNSSDIMQTTEAICHKITRLYALIPGSFGNKYFNRSDSYSYFSKGYKVNYLSEYRFSPYFHSMIDIYQNCNFEYMKEIAKINFGLLYHYAIDSLEVNNISEAPLYFPAQTFNRIPLRQFAFTICIVASKHCRHPHHRPQRKNNN